MKVNIKDCTPVKTSASKSAVFMRDNTFSPPSSIEHDAVESSGGRQVRYEATLVLSPVYASSRLSSDQYLCHNAVEEITNNLETLMLGKEEAKTCVTDDEDDDETYPGAITANTTDTTDEGETKNAPPKLARMDQTIVLAKSLGTAAVKRSARLVGSKQYSL